MLSLQNFEQEISGAMLQRGRLYYTEGYVTGLEEVADQQWTAEVEGSETYQVEVILATSTTIKDSSCDCPYDGSPCKHEVAVFFALRHELAKKALQPKAKLKKDVVEALLQQTSLQELQNFIKAYATKNKTFQTDFEIHFADKDERIDIAKNYEGLLKKIIGRHTNRGYIDYRSNFAFSNEAGKLVETGEDFLRKKNYKDAFAVARGLLRPMLDAMTQSDDSNGSIGGLIEDIISLLQKIAEAEDAATSLKEQLLLYLQATLADNDFFEYGDMGYHLLDVFQTLAVQLSQTNLLLQWLNTQLKKEKPDSYRRKDFVQRKMELFTASGQNIEADNLVFQNMDIPEVRKGEVAKAVAKNDFAKAKKLIAEGIKIAQALSHSGTVSDWQKQLLQIAVRENDIPTIRHYTKQFAFSHWFSGEDFYGQWKATYPAAEWKTIVEEVIKERTAAATNEWKAQRYRNSTAPDLLHTLNKILIREQYWNRLLALVQQANDLATTLQYHPHLYPHYPAELMALYLPALEQLAHRISNRSAYADLATKMLLIMRDMPQGREPLQALARKLISVYSVKPRRPAMVEELGRVLGK